MTKYLIFLITLVFVFYGAANADFYKWEDENGTVHITDYPPPDTKSSKNVEVHKDKGEQTPPPQDQEEEDVVLKGLKKMKNPEVVLFTKDECKDCDSAREFLKSRKIPFKEYNMDQDKKARAERKEIDEGEDVPFAIINRTQVYGFSESVYDRALKLVP